MTAATTPEQPRTAKRSRLDVGAFTAAEVQTMARAIGASVDQVRRLTECAVTIGNLQRVEAQARPAVARQMDERGHFIDWPTPAAASEGLRAALERLVKWGEALPGGIPEVTSFGWDNLRACIEQARAALASDAERQGES